MISASRLYAIPCSLCSRKVHREGFVETPGRARRSRKSTIPDESKNGTDTSDTSPETLKRKRVAPTPDKTKKANASATPNGRANGSARSSKATIDPKIDDQGHFEFGGSLGVSAMMIFFPL